MTETDQALVERLMGALRGASSDSLQEIVTGFEEIEEIRRNLGPQTRDELWQAFKDRYGIELVRKAVCPGHSSQLDFVWCVWCFISLLGVFSRGYGKTSLMGLTDALQCDYFPGFNSFTIGPGKDQGERKYEHILPFVIEGGVIGGKELNHIQRSIQTRTEWKNKSKMEIALGGCLGRAAKIITREGTIPIGKIVNDKLSVEVKSYDFDRQEWVWSRVIDWHKNGHQQDRKRWRRLKYRYGPTGPSHLTATDNHLVFRPDGSKTAIKDLIPGQKVCVPAQKLSYEQYQAFIGTMLGDGSLLNTATLSITHSIHQAYYLDWFDDCFSEFGPNRSIRQRFGNQQETTRYKVSMWSKTERDKWYPQGVKRIPDDVWDDLDVLGLAVWVMDDGIFVRKPTQTTGTWSICTHHFDQHECHCVDKFFDRIGIDGQWKCVDRDKDHYIWMTRGVEASNMLTVLLHPYIDISERQHRGWKRWCADEVVEHSSEVLWPVDVEVVECLDSVPGEYARQQSITGNGKLFDITVEGTHSYCTAAGVLISNSIENANGPRSVRLHNDEAELMLAATRKQAYNIPAGKQSRDGRYMPAQTVETSTMKWANGYVDLEMQAYYKKLKNAEVDWPDMNPIDAFNLAVERGHRPRKLMLVSCVFEVAAENPACRSVPEAERRMRLIERGHDPDEICQCNTYESDVWESDDEDKPARPRTLEDVCQGRFFRSRGYQKFADIQQAFLDNDRQTWEAEKECSEPSREGAYIKAYSQDRHGIRGYQPDPENGLIYTTTDWGSSGDAHWTGWVQELTRPVQARSYKGSKIKTLPIGSIVFFSEFYKPQIGNVEAGKKVVEREELWFLRWPGWSVHERYYDSANRGAMLDWRDQLGLKLTNRIRKDFAEEVKMVRTMAGGWTFYVDVPACPALDASMRGWRQVNGREVRNEHTHAAAGTRYFVHNRHVVERALTRAKSRSNTPQAGAAEDEERLDEREAELERGIRVVRQEPARTRSGHAGAEDSPLRASSDRIAATDLRTREER